MNEYALRASDLFKTCFRKSPETVLFAPGRVNLIGEHVDYNGGRVMPCSLSLGTYAAAARRNDGVIRLVSVDMGGAAVETISEELASLPCVPLSFARFGWAEYPLGVAAKLIENGFCIGGFEMAVCGSLPRGSGLSSSASLEVLTCAVLKELFFIRLTGEQAALISLAAERDCAGVNCGVMDQFICAKGRKDHAMLLDTHTLSNEYLPFDLKDAELLIMNTNKPRRLAGSKYNERRAECEEALRLINAAGLDKKHLCDITEEGLAFIEGALPETLRRRARHAVTENIRTLKAAEALKTGDIVTLGKLMNASHDSLKNDYEVTGKELDSIVYAARDQEGVLGARMTGAGFGGCAIAIVKKDAAKSVIESVTARYKAETGLTCSIYTAKTGEAPFGKE